MDCVTAPEIFLSKFDIEGNAVYAKILWRNTKDDLFQIQVFSGELSWTGKFSFDMCKTFGENVDENEEQYSKNVKDALKKKDDTYTYDFKLSDCDNDAKFYWKRTFLDSTATLVHGFVSLEKDITAGTKNDIIEFLLEENKNLCMTLEMYTSKTKKLESDLKNWENDFKKFVDIKNSLETTLYGKFVQLLNTKKKRIQELEDHLDE